MYDLVIIGAGPGGYVCAIRAAQLGLKVAMVEKESTYGGTCLNVGCIPSKALLQTSEMYHSLPQYAKFGIQVQARTFDLKAMMAYKEQTVGANVQGVAYLLKKNKVECFQGLGQILRPGEVRVRALAGTEQNLETRSIVIATGSKPASLPSISINEQNIVSSTGALSFPTLPKKLCVIGAGVIGLELGSVWARLGSEVVVLDYAESILPSVDQEMTTQFQRVLQKQGLTFQLGVKVKEIGEEKNGSLKILVESRKDQRETSFNADKVLVAVGRVPYTEGLGLENLGIASERGQIHVNAHFETNVGGIYALGDVIRGPMLAHKAEEEGVAVAEHLAGQHPHINYNAIPNVIYTSPEIATVGLTEEMCQAQKIPYKVGKFPFSANARARIMNQTDGFVKILAHAQGDKLLGAHIMGPHAGELIHEAVAIIEFGGAAEDLARLCHAHPTLSEAVKEAALGVDKRSLHI